MKCLSEIVHLCRVCADDSAVPQVQNKTVNSMEVYFKHESGLLIKFLFEKN